MEIDWLMGCPSSQLTAFVAYWWLVMSFSSTPSNQSHISFHFNHNSTKRDWIVFIKEKEKLGLCADWRTANNQPFRLAFLWREEKERGSEPPCARREAKPNSKRTRKRNQLFFLMARSGPTKEELLSFHLPRECHSLGAPLDGGGNAQLISLNFITFIQSHQFLFLHQRSLWMSFVELELKVEFVDVRFFGRSHWRCSAHNPPKEPINLNFLHPIQPRQNKPFINSISLNWFIHWFAFGRSPSNSILFQSFSSLGRADWWKEWIWLGRPVSTSPN